MKKYKHIQVNILKIKIQRISILIACLVLLFIFKTNSLVSPTILTANISSEGYCPDCKECCPGWQQDSSGYAVPFETTVPTGDSCISNLYFIDNFNGTNDTSSLMARGYKVYYRGTGIQGIIATWFQGNNAIFPSFNGPLTGYVAADYRVVNGTNNIDNWLMLPRKYVTAGDSLSFYSRSPFNSLYPDSIRVMYSAFGDSVPEAGSWVELGRFKVTTGSLWQRNAFSAPISGAHARFAIRYTVANGGPTGINSEYIGIDALTFISSSLMSPSTPPNYVGPVSINTPVFINFPSPPVMPQATVRNFGTAAQTFPVTMTINPGGYTSTHTVTGLISNATMDVNFAPYIPPGPGAYFVEVYTQLSPGCNDTLRQSLIVNGSTNNPNYGTNISTGYSFANSTPGASGAPSQPQFCWRDTTGSTTLIQNGVVSDISTLTGTIDDGYFKIVRPYSSGRRIRFFGNGYDTIRVGTNGIIAFQSFMPGGGNWDPPTSGIPGGTVLKAFYPLWTDLNFEALPGRPNRLSYKVSGKLLIITYDKVPAYLPTDSLDYVSFQVIIEGQFSSSTVDSRLVVQFDRSRTGNTFYNKYKNNTTRTHLSGLQDSTGTRALQYRFRNSSSVVTNGPIFDTTTNSSLALELGPDNTQLNFSCLTLNLTLNFEGNSSALANKINDTIIVDLRDASGPPYNLLESKKAIYDHVTGGATIEYSLFEDEALNNFYIVVSHRNSISTWSATPQSFKDHILSFDFSSAQYQAYGNNQILINKPDRPIDNSSDKEFDNTGDVVIESKIENNRDIASYAAIYSGDVNQDYSIDGIDGLLIETDVVNFVCGDFVITDLNFDGCTDGSDLAICENNASNFICQVAPPGALNLTNVISPKYIIDSKSQLRDNIDVGYMKDSKEYFESLDGEVYGRKGVNRRK